MKEKRWFSIYDNFKIKDFLSLLLLKRFIFRLEIDRNIRFIKLVCYFYFKKACQGEP
jgi:hypothetical protein